MMIQTLFSYISRFVFCPAQFYAQTQKHCHRIHFFEATKKTITSLQIRNSITRNRFPRHLFAFYIIFVRSRVECMESHDVVQKNKRFQLSAYTESSVLVVPPEIELDFSFLNMKTIFFSNEISVATVFMGKWQNTLFSHSISAALEKKICPPKNVQTNFIWILLKDESALHSISHPKTAIKVLLFAVDFCAFFLFSICWWRIIIVSNLWFSLHVRELLTGGRKKCGIDEFKENLSHHFMWCVRFYPLNGLWWTEKHTSAHNGK